MCKHWQLSKRARKHFTHADCNRVIGYLEPELFKYNNIRGYKFNVPFDPQSRNDFYCSANFDKLFRKVLRNLPDGVRIERNGTYYYFQTEEDFSCEYFEAL